jgi:polyphosphate kinase
MTNNLFNRELSWLSFNYRVLQEAKDPSVPLYERIKFLAIYSSNLDEFFRVRVASLRSLLKLKTKTQKKLAFDPVELLKRIHKTVIRQQEEFGQIFREQIIPALEQNNIFIVNDAFLLPEHKNYLTEFFETELKAALQPIILDKKVETFLRNKSIYLAVRLENIKKEISEQKKKKRFRYALIEIPSDKFGRFIVLPETGSKHFIISLDDTIRIFLSSLFPGYNIESVYSVKLTRDAELYIDDEFAGDLLEKIKKSLSKRKTGVPSRFLYDSGMSKGFLKFLRDTLKLNKDDLIPGGRYHNFNDFFSFPNPGSNNFLYEPMPPLNCKELETNNSFFNTITKGDILLHYPYQSYNYAIKFLEEAAEDENVTSIYITLYRVAANSLVVKALSKAAEKGKKVTAFVEVKARFDEESNFSSAEELQKAGVKVFYSFPGLKVHSKICLISRKEDNEKTYYAYLATGNFNEKTARIYSDLGLFTKDIRFTKEARKIFNILTKKSEKEKFNYLLAAPFNLRSSLNELIENEIANAQAGKSKGSHGKAYVILKLNSLEDRKMINRLYAASQAGVKIFIIVRGICCLIPGVKGLSNNIRVISIVDRYLEHARVFIFCNGGDEKYFVSSADLMTRNLSRRIEVCFPVYNDEIKKQIRKFIDIQLNDGVKARLINKFQNNQYKKTKSNIRAQYAIYEYLKEKNSENIVGAAG